MKIKKYITKYYTMLSLVAGYLFVIANNAQADWGTGMGNAQSFGLPDPGYGKDNAYYILATILNWLLSIVGILGVIGFVVAGITYLTAYGDEKAIAKAKNMMTYSATGVVIALIGLIVVAAVASIFGGSGSAFNNSY